MTPLTLAELRTLQAMAGAGSSKEAASNLGISEQTLRNEAAHAYRKLGVSNRTAAFRRLGWLKPPRISKVLMIGIVEGVDEPERE